MVRHLNTKPDAEKYFILLSVVITSCRFNGSLQGMYGYYGKTKAANPDLFLKPDSSGICAIEKTAISKVIVTNGL
jgi:hypothetical protein